MKYLLIPIIYTLMNICSISPVAYSQAFSTMPDNPDACYARCLIPSIYEKSYEEVIIFTGDDDNTNAAIDTIDYEISPDTTIWVKKKADKKCLSANPDDCLVCCLENVDAVTEQVIIVTDTTTTKDFQIIDFEKIKLISQGGVTEWREVVCEEDLDISMIKAIQQQLKEQGFYSGEVDGISNDSLKKSLVQFQRKNGFPEGQFDLESLNGLGIIY